MAPVKTVQVVKAQIDLDPVNDRLERVESAVLQLAELLGGVGELASSLGGVIYAAQDRQIASSTARQAGAAHAPWGAVQTDTAPIIATTWPVPTIAWTSPPIDTQRQPYLHIQSTPFTTGITNILLSDDGVTTAPANGIYTAAWALLPVTVSLTAGTGYAIQTFGAKYVTLTGGAGTGAGTSLVMCPGAANANFFQLRNGAGTLFSANGGLADATVISTPAWVPLDVNANTVRHNGATYDRAKNNLAATLLASAGYTGTQTVQPITNFQGCGCVVTVDVATLNSANLTLHIQGQDPSSATYYDILVGTAITGAGLFAYYVHPAVTTTAGVAQSAVLPRLWGIEVVPAAGGLTDTYSVGSSITAT